jgi:pilus assembly protein Flp/PilA
MNILILKLSIAMRNLLTREDGQDLVEYALTVALIAFGCIAGMSSVATGIDNAFSQVASTLTTDV